MQNHKRRSLTDNCGLPADAETGSKSTDSTSAAATAVSFIVIMVTRVVLVFELVNCGGDGAMATTFKALCKVECVKIFDFLNHQR